ncbi:MAG TPA: hypothetical protein DDW24_03515 [Blastocatellia bacterium]|nr:hypothetical protein [Blastocatellia bacterium]
MKIERVHPLDTPKTCSLVELRFEIVDESDREAIDQPLEDCLHPNGKFVGMSNPKMVEKIDGHSSLISSIRLDLYNREMAR